MGLLKNLAFWAKRKNDRSNVIRETVSKSFRNCRFETMEERQVLSADPIIAGGVYIEDDSGTDSQADSFYVSFEGGSDTTEMTRIIIDGNQDGNAAQLSSPDVYFDITPGSGLGVGGASAFQFDAESIGLNASDIERVQVSDGGTQLIIDLKNFEAGDVLKFGIDVDQFFESKPHDQVTSGIEFAGSSFQAFFEDQHYNYTPTSGDEIGIFTYNFDFGSDEQSDTGVLSGLPTENNFENGGGSQENRSAGVKKEYDLTPKPVAIKGTVFHDRNADLNQDAGEEGIEGTTLRLQEQDANGNYVDVIRNGQVVTTLTDANGDYCFGEDLGLAPGKFRIVETQPDGYEYSTGAKPGTVEGVDSGIVENENVIAEVCIELGGQQSIDNDFGEIKAAKLSGYVYHDRNFSGDMDAGDVGIANTEIKLQGTDIFGNAVEITGFTDDAGYYCFEALVPGTYEICEVQPNGFADYQENVGTVRGATVGQTVQNDKFTSVTVGSGETGIEYNFGEVTFASLSGHVHITTPDGRCVTADSPEYRAIEGAEVRLIDANGNVQTAHTDANGFYEFTGLQPGDYTIVEVTPDGYLDGDERVGTVDGNTVGQLSGNDRMTTISLVSGDAGVNYDFCEVEPASISGHVKLQTPNGDYVGPDHPDYVGLENVRITLTDADGNVLTTRTDANGFYEFTDLAPGEYTIREFTPAGYIDGAEGPGTVGGQTRGNATTNDRIGNIDLQGGDEGINYDFCEIEPASISGHVKLQTPDGTYVSPGHPDYVGIEGVQIDLIDSAGNVVSTTTDANGYYEFTDLNPGTYGIVEHQPTAYADGAEEAGTINGQTVGAVISNDRLGNIVLGGGEQGINYDFCEVGLASISGHVKLQTENGTYVDPDHPDYVGVEGVRIDLTNSAGDIVSTTTDANGYYEFTDLAPGTYSIIEHQPDGYIDGGEEAGTIDGQTVGAVLTNDRLGNIDLQAGDAGINYDFCEIPPASVCGVVYHDRNDNGVQDAGEEGISGVALELLNADGSSTGQIVRTDSDGSYCFTDLAPGEYKIAEVQPAGWIDGKESVGTVNGQTVGTTDQDDALCDIVLAPGQNGVEYNFGELKPSSISGYVHTDLNGDCVYDQAQGEEPLSGVTMRLLDSDGNIVEETLTDANGFYRFEDLRAGEYTVVQIQPNGYSSGGENVGTVEGSGDAGSGTVSENLISQITVGSDVDLIHYDFCEVPPAKLSGYVFQDGAAITIRRGQELSPSEIRAARNGLLSSDDIRLAGVTLELRNGITGEVITADQVLPGYYDEGPVRVVTDINGHYCFDGLPAGNYAVFEIQPDGYIDNVDTAGTTDGVAINPTDDVSPFVLSTLADGVDPGSDAILRIAISAGGHSEFNNFSEVTTETRTNQRQRDRSKEFKKIESYAAQTSGWALPGLAGAQGVSQNTTVIAGLGTLVETPGSYVWQLSVINDGSPRGDEIDAKDGITWRSASFLNTSSWNSMDMSAGRWMFTNDDVQEIEGEAETMNFVMGRDGAFPVVGDFNGDGKDEFGLYVNGEWYIDASGNRHWGQEDMWAKLGTSEDHPLVGDWDGDGKDDIGVYGRHNNFNEDDLRREPGIPDTANFGDTDPKNIPPTVSQRPEFQRHLKRTQSGQQRTDVVDHIFRYGGEGDYPIVGDWNGDGIRTVGLFNDGRWTLDVDGNGRMSAADETINFGRAGDIPVVGDFDGDGVEDIGVFRDGKWIIDVDGNYELDAHDKVFELGGRGDIPVVGDFDGDGVDEPAVYQSTHNALNTRVNFN